MNIRKEDLTLVRNKFLKGSFADIVRHLVRPYIYISKEIYDYLVSENVDFVYYNNELYTYGNCDSDKLALMKYE